MWMEYVACHTTRKRAGDAWGGQVVRESITHTQQLAHTRHTQQLAHTTPAPPGLASHTVSARQCTGAAASTSCTASALQPPPNSPCNRWSAPPRRNRAEGCVRTELGRRMKELPGRSTPMGGGGTRRTLLRSRRLYVLRGASSASSCRCGGRCVW